MQRSCSDCRLCCKLMPVADMQLKKGAGVRCPHQAHHVGCRIHGTNKMPASCRLWNCQWLVDDDTADLRRPDRSHYVLDISPDYVTLQDNETGKQINMPVLQIWCDPNYPDAHRDPALRDLLDRKHVAALVRYNSKDGFLLVPPSVAHDGKWHEKTSGSAPSGQHSAADVYKVLRETT